MKKYTTLTLFSSLFLIFACNNAKTFDASGSFEAEEVIISSEANGTIKQFDIEEGQTLKTGQIIGFVDTTQLFLKKKQLEVQVNALLSKKPNIIVQLGSLKEQLKSAEKEQKRIGNLVKSDAATQKQLDDILAQIEFLKKQIDAQQSSLEISTASIDKESMALEVQIEQLTDQLKKCYIICPIDGTVLSKYAKCNETTAFGKPLFRIADLSTIYLRAYISGDQLPLIKLNQKVTVSTDNGNGSFKKTDGTIVWISDKAEFTPKTIQTKNERANQVYAIKVKVVNDGAYKIGMYGELNFN